MGEQSISAVQEQNRSMTRSSTQSARWPVNEPIRVLSMVEAKFVTGPAKSLMEFAATAATPSPDLPCVQNFIATFQRTENDNEFVTRARGAGLDVSVVREGFAFDPRVIPQLRSIIAQTRPHIIQSMNFKAHFLMRLLNVRKGCKWIAFHHGYTWTDAKNSAYNQLDRWSLRKADAVVTVCVPFARELERFGVKPDKLTVQHNSIRPFIPSPAEEVERLKKSLGIPEGAFALVSVGRLSKEKGHTDLIEALAKIREASDRPVRLIIVGDGPERAALESKVTSLNLREWVVFAGFQSNVAPYYQLADVAVLPSHSEGSPYALLEAMAAGVPVVATSVGGVPEIATDKLTALLVERDSPEQLSKRIVELIQDEGLGQRLSAAARERVSQYDPETYRRNLTQLYLRVLAEPKSR